jgi:transcriptional regulator with XRE-family HTH domain
MGQKKINQVVGKIIRQLREKKGISQEELADTCGLDRTYISGIERNKRNVTLATLEKIIPAICDSSSVFFRLVSKELVNE